MFLSGSSRSWCNRDGSQHASGFFLVLMQPDGMAIGASSSTPIRGLVRSVKLHQSGHFMTGFLQLSHKSTGVQKIYLSGSYGADGLTRDVPRCVYELGVVLPPELRKAWNEGGGHNSCGNEAPEMDKWAKTLEWPASTYKRGK